MELLCHHGQLLIATWQDIVYYQVVQLYCEGGKSCNDQRDRIVMMFTLD